MSETVYKKVDPTLRSLVDDIKMREIGLPGLQRLSFLDNYLDARIRRPSEHIRDGGYQRA